MAITDINFFMDLTPQANPSASDDNFIIGPHDQMPDASRGNALNGQLTQQIDDWLQQIQQGDAQYYATIQQQVAPLQSKLNSLDDDYQYELFQLNLARYMTDDEMLGHKYIPTSTPVNGVGPFQTAVYVYDQTSPAPGKKVPWWLGFDIISYFSVHIELGVIVPPVHQVYVLTSPGPYATQVLTSLQSTLSQIDDTFNQIARIESQKPPNTPDFPTLQGDDYTKFDYSVITISGDDWSYQL